MTDALPPDGEDPPVMLVIGDVSRWEARGRGLPRIERCHFLAPEDLGAEILAELNPDFVVSALFGPGVDAIDIAQTLSEHGFKGAYRAIVESLPNVAAVRTEIRSAAPGMDFDILTLTETG